MRRLAVLAGTIVTAGGIAYAASGAGLAPFTSASIASGEAAIGSCDADGFTVAYSTSGGNVTSVTVGDTADPGCEGGELSVTLTDASGAALASGGPQAIPADGDTSPNVVVVALGSQPAAELVAGYRFVVTGP